RSSRVRTSRCGVRRHRRGALRCNARTARHAHAPPSPTPYDCGQLPAPKCEVMRRVEQDHRDAIDRWQALAERSYVPILGVTFVDSSPRTTLPPSTPSPSPEPSVRACAAADLVGAL